MKAKITYLSISLLILFNIMACNSVKGYLPDKEKDYQLMTEIPALIIPDDLTNNAIKDAPVIQARQAVQQRRSRAVANTDTAVETEADATTQATENEENIYIDLVEFSGGATRIRMEQNLESSWRTVGKALSRQSIEITDRNEEDKVYFVQYDPDFKKVEDGSLWDEALFLFGSDPSQEKEYRVRLVENGTLTEIIVFDSNDKPMSKGIGFKLLNLLYRTMKDDLANSS